MTIFGQKDYPEELGTGTGATIAQYGCALTDVASILVNCFGKDTDPSRLNKALIGVDGFASNGDTALDIIKWASVTSVYPDITLAFNNSYPSSPADMNLIDGQLNKGCSVIVGVDFNHSVKATVPSHYVEVYKKNQDGTYQCRDPWFKDDTNFNSRYAVNGMSVAQCILQAVSYNGPVIGDLQTQLSQSNADRDINWNGWSALSTELGVAPNPDNKTQMQKDGVDAILLLKQNVTEARNQTAEVNKKLEDEQGISQGLRTANSLLTKTDEDLGIKLLDAQHKVTEYKNGYQEIADELKTTPDLTSIMKALFELKAPVDEQVKPLQNYTLTLLKAFEELTYKRKTQINSFWSNLIKKILSLFKKGVKK